MASNPPYKKDSPQKRRGRRELLKFLIKHSVNALKTTSLLKLSVLSVSTVNLSFTLLLTPLVANGPGYFPPWGKDSELMFYEEDAPVAKRTDLLSIAAEKVILFHQNVISPVDGPRSHFRPTSARYMLLAMRRHGFFIGYIKGCDRLLRENKDPWIYRTRTIDNVIYKWDPTYS
jgi:uncharacterized protein